MFFNALYLLLLFDLPASNLCPNVKKDALNVHLICNSHLEVGWIETVDQYYDHYVRNILNSVVAALKSNSNRKFVQVENAFFYKWWSEQNLLTRNIFKKLVCNGQIEMAGGGWTVNDEATCYYQAIIDQFTLGFRILNDTLGSCGKPKVGWQTDVYGHSKAMCSIFNQFGFDGIFLERIDFREKSEMFSDKNGDFLWDSGSGLVFASLLKSFDDYCFDPTCEEVIGGTNKFSKARKFIDYLTSVSDNYPTNNILVSLGRDFHFQKAEETFSNIDSFIRIVHDMSSRKNINVFYSTPSCYVKSVKEAVIAKNITLRVKTGDFFPYASQRHVYWTGFYTSRPTLKRMEREGNNLLQASKQLSSFLLPQIDFSNEIFDLEKIMATMQHHNAITGTQTKAVSKDFIAHLSSAIEKTTKFDGVKILRLIKIENTTLKVQFNSCPLANISQCPYTSAHKFLIALYNPLGRWVDYYVKVPVTGSVFTITTANDEIVEYQVSLSMNSLRWFNGISGYDLVFLAKNVPPLGIKIYHVNVLPGKSNLVPETGTNKFNLGSNTSGITIDESGHLNKITINGKEIKLEHTFMTYNSYVEYSGAYIFRPAGQATSIDSMESFKVYKGILFDEVVQDYGGWAMQIIRVYKKKSFVEFDWMIGPLEDDTEVISRFYSNVNNRDTFYTDSNGRGFIKRRRNFRDSFFFDADEGVTANYYPVVSKIYIEDIAKSIRLEVVTDRAQGGTSLFNGQLELMLHRSIQADDHLGLEEGLQENDNDHGGIVRGHHFLTLSNLSSMDNDNLVLEQVLQPWIFIADLTKINKASYDDIKNKINFMFSGMNSELPNGVHLLTLEPWKVKENLLLIRLENICHESRTVQLNNLFTSFTINSLTEMTLGANEILKDGLDLRIVLEPKQFRTFVINVNY